MSFSSRAVENLRVMKTVWSKEKRSGFGEEFYDGCTSVSEQRLQNSLLERRLKDLVVNLVVAKHRSNSKATPDVPLKR